MSRPSWKVVWTFSFVICAVLRVPALSREITMASDNGKRKTADEIKVNLHGATGTVDRYVATPATLDARASAV